MSAEKAKGLPIITRMPVVKPEVLSALRTEREQDGEAYFWSLGADLARKHS